VATLRKRGPRQWQAQVRRRGYPLQSKTFSTRAAADQWARAIEYELDNGLFASRVEAESTTLAELLQRVRLEFLILSPNQGQTPYCPAPGICPNLCSV